MKYDEFAKLSCCRFDGHQIRNLPVLRTYRNNINRYHWLLKTELSALERQFIDRRLNEEKSAMGA